ncbi:DNA translocase FtsK 4TM domain-containing protein [Neptunicella marina]|uniref:DNA translocase FtsK n=1 Tax=Neptunicella marina TaxID=2125989 RepID=A0A8J6J079_9ALTE|nr:DNA translocase FtsK 4TM domain-containing protein [Neptunicella marina]
MARLSGIQRILEAGMILTCAFALFLLLALGTFDPADPSWSQAGHSGSVSNAAGPAGAWFADILLFTFGFVAYIFPFLSALLGWFLFQQAKDLLEMDYLTISLRVIGGILGVLGACGLASLNFDDPFYFPAGGFIGDILSASLLPMLNMPGSILLLLCFLCTGFTLVTGISWLSIIDFVGEWVIRGAKGTARVSGSLGNFSAPRLMDFSRKSQQLENKQQEPERNIEITSMRVEPEVEVTPVHSPKIDEFDQPAATRKKRKDKAVKSDVKQEPVVNLDDMMDLSDDMPIAHDSDESSSATHRTAQDVPWESDASASGSVTPMPTLDLLDRADKVENPISKEELEQVARLVEEKLANFNVDAKVVGVYPGPVITRFELDLAAGVKVSRISGLSKDLARELSAISVRVVEVIPGKSVIGLELPNKNRETVRLSEVLSCQDFADSASPLTMVLGQDIAGQPVVVDLAKMPHLLVAGTTGSGKSVGVNVMILSLLYKSTPEDVRIIMIDPKMLELSVYEGIPHLLTEVVTDMNDASNALRWCVAEMERRYRLMSALGVRNLKGFNAKIKDAIAAGQPIKDPLWKAEEGMATEAPDLEKLPSIVVIVDEFADMMMIVGKKVEELIARIAQKARAAGIHLVLATQRPSVDVITGLIKANIPTRIAFQVSSKIDSRTILDQQGAESLLGMGDMLYLPPGTSAPTRVHGAFVDDHEVHAVVSDWKQRAKPNYIDEILNGDQGSDGLLPGEQPEGGDSDVDALFDDVVAFVTTSRKVSTSLVQRHFHIGYNRAARIVDQMELNGVISAAAHNGNREVLAPPPV